MVNVDYSVCWQDILERMAAKGIPPDSTQLHAFSYYERRLQEIWHEIFEERYQEEQSYEKPDTKGDGCALQDL